jgi:hypothetical protein
MQACEIFINVFIASSEMQVSCDLELYNVQMLNRGRCADGNSQIWGGFGLDNKSVIFHLR